LRQARQAQTELAAGQDRGPLHGIPISIKDLVDVATVPMTGGSNVLRHNIAQRDAAVVARLRDVGTVLVGKTNLLEFAYGIVHPDFGPANNPWNPTLTAGGSSGGSAAAVSAGMSYAAFGTDTGGSIRVPAAYCGVAGLKPTYGLVDLEGVFPLSWSLDHGGPMTRTCADAALFLDGLIGQSGPSAIAPFRLPSVSGLRLGILAEHLTGRELQPAVLDAFNRTVALLRDAGAQVTEISVPDLDLADRLLLTIVAPEAAAIHA
jgi:aspartyl-tRNA(Asn)/glutamyl-tRNA(Gln) amidotransferase subunit A